MRVIPVLLGGLALMLAGCRFDPSLGGGDLTGCLNDADCPRGGACNDGICTPRPLAIADLRAMPPTVNAGDTCVFEVEAVHAGGPNQLRYYWRQRLGPEVELSGVTGTRVELTTLSDFAGEYEVEVRVSNGFDPPVVGQVGCFALVDDGNAAFIVDGEDGDCSRDNPCGSVDTSSGATHFYLAVPRGAPAEIVYPISFSDMDGREIHGGFVFPGWQREMAVAHTAMASPSSSLSLNCSDCVVTGLYRKTSTDYFSSVVLSVSGQRVQLRSAVIILAGRDRDDTMTDLVDITAAEDVTLEAISMSVLPGSPNIGELMDLTGIDGAPGSSGHTTLRELDIDLSGVVTQDKFGIDLGGETSSSFHLERVRIRTGGVVRNVRGLYLNCGTYDVWTTVVDTRGSITGGSQQNSSLALGLYDYRDYCPVRPTVQSSLFMGGSGDFSRALSFAGHSVDPVFKNSIFDAGDGYVRHVVRYEGTVHDDGAEFPGSIFLISGDLNPLDGWGSDWRAATIDEDELFVDLGTDTRPVLSHAAAFADRDGGDFHLTRSSDCCRDTGETIDPQAGPLADFEGIPWADPPSVGPYQYTE